MLFWLGTLAGTAGKREVESASGAGEVAVNLRADPFQAAGCQGGRSTRSNLGQTLAQTHGQK